MLCFGRILPEDSVTISDWILKVCARLDNTIVKHRHRADEKRVHNSSEDWFSFFFNIVAPAWSRSHLRLEIKLLSSDPMVTNILLYINFSHHKLLSSTFVYWTILLFLGIFSLNKYFSILRGFFQYWKDINFGRVNFLWCIVYCTLYIIILYTAIKEQSWQIFISFLSKSNKQTKPAYWKHFDVHLSHKYTFKRWVN